MKTKIFTALVAAVLLASTFIFPVNAASTIFTDVPSDAWYYDSVGYVYEKGWMNGTGNDRFSPDGSLTRAMMAVILWRLEDRPDFGQTMTFKDTISDAWYADGLSWCIENGFFTGYPDGSFKPYDSVTREQLALIFYRYANASPADSAGKAELKNGCAWASDACKWANAKGLFTDALGTLDLCASVGRAEIACWLFNYDTVCEDAPSLTEGSFEEMNYLLYKPANAAADMPLIVYLHGGHGKGSDLSVLTGTDGFPQYLADGLLGEISAYVLIPQLPEDQRGWISDADIVMQLIEHICNEDRIDRNRISLTGHSMGGTGTWDLALAYPDTFSHIAPMSGSVQTTSQNLDALKNTKVWAFAGEDDVVVKPESSEKFVAALKMYDQDAKITVFSNTDHIGVPQKAWLENGKELLNWLTE